MVVKGFYEKVFIRSKDSFKKEVMKICIGKDQAFQSQALSFASDLFDSMKLKYM
jgi:hypothetical protein